MTLAQSIAAGELRARLAAVLKAEVEDRGMTTADLVQASGLPRRTVYDARAGNVFPRERAFVALALALGLSQARMLRKMSEVEIE